MDHLAECKAHNHQKCSQEHEHGQLGGGSDFLVKRGCLVHIHVFVNLGICLAGLELGIVVQVLAPLVRCQGRAHEAYDAGGDGNHEHLRDAHHVAVGVGDGHKCNHGGGDGRTCNTHLGGDGGHAARPLRTDVLLEGYVTDNGHYGIYHVAGSNHNGEEEGHKRSQECDVVRVLAQDLFRYLDHPVHTAGSL